MTDKTLQDRLREHRVILKSGEYDGAQLMAAWCDMVNAADALDAQAERIKALKGALKHERSALALVRDRQCRDGTCHVALADINKGIALLDRALLGEK